MEKLILTIVFIVLALVSSSRFVFAHEATEEEHRLEAQAKQEARQERRGAVIADIAIRVENRFERHEERLQDWIDKATTHAEKLNGKGRNVTDVMTALATARASLKTASTLGDEAIAKLKAIEPEVWYKQQPEALAAREAVKKAQVAYAQVIKDMKQVVTELKKVTTSTE